jgi:ectoine hydroxylase-related dioxygenase (phytanoyl-CoA dioxygenase family)
MKKEKILSFPARVLSEEQRQRYFETGYLQLPRFIGNDWIERLRSTTAGFVEQSRALTESNEVILLEPRHTADNPRPLRLNQAVNHHSVYWEFATQSALPDLAADLVGPDVKFRESTINFKWAEGGSEVRWHQDIPFFPHTNLNLFVALLWLDDVGADQGPLKVIPGSHNAQIFRHYDKEGNWIGRISDEDLTRVPIERAISLTGPAGTVSVLHCATVHGSEANFSSSNRTVLILGYQSADSFGYTPFPRPTRYTGHIIRGSAPKYAHLEARDMPLPPDWSKGFTSIFENQQRQ